MTPEQQAQKLAEWLDSHPGAEPPAGLEPDVVEAVYALRPDLAPAPRVSVDDILGAVTSGPLALGAADAAADDDDEASGAAVVPFPSPGSTVVSTTPARWGRWALGTGAGTLLAMAAAVLLVVRVVAIDGAPDAPTAKMESTGAPPADAPVATASSEPVAQDEPEVAMLEEGEDFVDDLGGEFDRLGSAGSGVSGWADPTAGLDASGSGEARKERAPEPSLVRPTPRPSPSPAPRLARESTATPSGPAVARSAAPPPVATTPAARPIDAITDLPSEPAVADLDEGDDALRGDSFAEPAPIEVAAASGVTTRDRQSSVSGTTTIQSGRTIDLAAREESSRDQKPNVESISEARSPSGRRDPARRSADAAAARQEAEEAQAVAASEPGGAVVGGLVADAEGGAEAKVKDSEASGLEVLRARAVPPDLPQSELLSRSLSPANEDARGYAADGRFVEAGNALVPTLSLPAPEGSTNAAQAATWFLQGGDPTLARTAAEAGLSNTTGNTPERSWLYVLYGDALRRSGDTAGATRAYAEAIELNDDRRGATGSAPAETSDPGR